MGKLAAWTIGLIGAAVSASSAMAQDLPEGWRFVLGIDGKLQPCTIVREGPVGEDPHAVNARIIRNGKNKIVLVAARPDWRLNPDLGPADFKLVVDGGEPVQMQGSPLGPLLLAGVDDPGLEQKLRTAQTLKWIAPWGEFHATVTGLGAAFDKTTICPE